MINNDPNKEELVALTEQGNLGLGVHKGKDEEERELLRKQLERLEKQTK